MTVAALETEQAYRRCEQITRVAAANFYYGIRLLPRSKRYAMSAVYAFARRVDDIGDSGELDREHQLRALAAEREMVESLSAGESTGQMTPSQPGCITLCVATSCRRTRSAC